MNASALKGANKLQEFWHVTVPGIRPTLAFIVSLSLMWSFLTFDYVWAMTQGGPGQATEILSTWIYRNAFNYYRSAMPMRCVWCKAESFSSSSVFPEFLSKRRRSK